MSVFAGYARYYDRLYRDKDYAGEAAYVAACLRRHAPEARRLLELGCGSGAHALELARLGFETTGIDLSQEMLEAAEARRDAAAEPLRRRLRFARGDARNYRGGAPFDGACALFHVLSYQCTDRDLAGMLRTAAAHLVAGAPFVFDFWFGPAVLAQRPEVRTRRLADPDLEIERLAEPTLQESASCVEVRYTLRVRERAAGGRVETLSETHRMRYFFLPELERALAAAGLRLESAAEMGTGAPLGEQTWSACAVALRR